jgi:hypothetical protein
MKRRTFLTTAAAAAPLAAAVEAQELQSTVGNPDLVQISSGDMLVTFDRGHGTIWAIQSKSDPLNTNFIGNPTNVRRPQSAMGDVMTTVWAAPDAARLASDIEGRTNQTSGQWRAELSRNSPDIRKVSFDGSALTVDFSGKSASEGGLRSLDVHMKYSFAASGSLIWELTLKNTSGMVLEVGELAFPFMISDDYGAYGNQSSDVLKTTGDKQRNIHEQKVLAFHYVGGHSSYSLIQRPMGGGPFLFVQPLDDTSFECMYRAGAGGRGGPDILAVHSHAPRQINRWREPWVNMHSSLVLQPGQEKSYRLAFKFIEDYSQIRDEVAAAGNVAIRIVPSMVVPEGETAYVELRSKEPIAKIEGASDGITFQSRKRTGDKELLAVAFKGRGQRTVRLEYGKGRWANLHFYSVEDIAERLKYRGKFIVDHQFYENPSDPYRRHHAFLPYDYATQSTFTDSEEVWEVGASDEFGFSEALFLAEKNVYYPVAREIATVETYVTDCLFKYIQNPETYKVRASLYYKERTPSMPWGCWSKTRSESTVRTYNYAHPANIYHALYRIGKQYGLITHRNALDYLKMSYRTAMVWFVTGLWQHIGVMGGSNAIYILDDLKKEGLNDEYSKLREEMLACLKTMVDDPYPYSSELTIDQTAHEQVYFFTKYFGETEKNLKTMRVIKALRGGNEPMWFRYGQDRRHFWSCWYSESLNGMALLDAYEQTGDPDMFIKGFAGVMSVSKNLLPDGMCFSEFVWNPGTFAHYPAHTREGGVGQWGFMRSMKSYVLRDEAFGLIGAGCRVAEAGGDIKITPRDGIRKKVYYHDRKLAIALAQGEIDSMALGRDGRIEMSVVDTTSVVKQAVMRIEGLAAGWYSVRHGATNRTVQVSGALEITVPISEAKSIVIRKA